MQIFYAPGIEGTTYTLDATESKHVVRVMRMSHGTAVILIDGKGNLYEGNIDNPDPKKCTISITGIVKNFERRDYRLHIAISPLKNPERLEWFIEKSVEIGIDEITPLICKNSEKKTVREDRINNLIVSAMKQSLKAEKTILNPITDFSSFINEEKSGKRFIAHCNNSFIRNRLSDNYSKGENCLILIGPEGDFSEEEIKYADNNGYISLQFGPSRLRTETAGIAACHSIYFLNH